MAGFSFSANRPVEGCQKTGENRILQTPDNSFAVVGVGGHLSEPGQLQEKGIHKNLSNL